RHPARADQPRGRADRGRPGTQSRGARRAGGGVRRRAAHAAGRYPRPAPDPGDEARRRRGPAPGHPRRLRTRAGGIAGRGGLRGGARSYAARRTGGCRAAVRTARRACRVGHRTTADRSTGRRSAKSHQLAHRESLQMADLAGENLHRKPADPGAMRSLSELMHLIALGRTVAVLPRVLTRPLRDDLITVPMSDLPPVDLLLAWPAHSTSRSVAALARAAAAAIRASADN